MTDMNEMCFCGSDHNSPDETVLAEVEKEKCDHAQRVLDSFALKGKITEEHAKEVLQILINNL